MRTRKLPVTGGEFYRTWLFSAEDTKISLDDLESEHDFRTGERKDSAPEKGAFHSCHFFLLSHFPCARIIWSMRVR
jgi:hypothetical protein